MASSESVTEKKKQMQSELTQLKSELTKKDREIAELRKQLSQTKGALNAIVAENKQNLEKLKDAKTQLGK